MSDDWDYWEARDAWKSDYYIVKDPPIAYGYMFEGCLAYDGCDFCMGFSREQRMTLLDRRFKEKQVPRWIAEAYGDGDICPGEIDWEGDAEIKWPRPPRTCTPGKPCFGSVHCRALMARQRDQKEIARLVSTLVVPKPPPESQRNRIVPDLPAEEMVFREKLMAIARKGDFDWHGYDYENIVSAACEFGPEFLDEILFVVEEKGGDVDRLAWEIDDDGYTAMLLYATRYPAIMAVFSKHGVDTMREIKSYAPFPSKDHYESYMQRQDREGRLAKFVRDFHGNRMRPDGAARRIDHAKNVVGTLERWSVFHSVAKPWNSAAAWCLGALDDADDPAMKREIESRVLETFLELPDKGAEALAALRLLVFDKSAFATEEEHLRHVAKKADSFALDLAAADRLCLVFEWLGCPENGRDKAFAALRAGNPVFDRICQECKGGFSPATPENRIVFEIERTRRLFDDRATLVKAVNACHLCDDQTCDELCGCLPDCPANNEPFSRGPDLDFLRHKQASLAVLCGVLIPENAAKPGAEDLAKDFSAEAAEAKAQAEKALGEPPKTNETKTATPQILVKRPERPWIKLDEIPDEEPLSPFRRIVRAVLGI